MCKAYKHFITITKHKFEVGKACFRAGLYVQGIIHDLSKYTLREFVECVQYYNGKISPIDKAKQVKGYCHAWLHHKGCNPHHYEYWIDGRNYLVIPYKYAMEMVCDYIGAGKIYEKEKWTLNSPINYWNVKKNTVRIHPNLILFFDKIFYEFSINGYDVLSKKHSKNLYYSCI